MNIAQKLSKKGADVSKIAAQAIENPESINDLIEGLTAPKGSLRFGFEKVLRLISEQRPDLVYPFFDTYVKLLDSENSFLKWGAILTIANLAAIDSDKRFDAIFKKYYSPITGPVMVTAANIIGSSARIAQAKPELTKRITREIMRVEKARFKHKGSPSTECRNVALGQAIDTFDKIYDQIDDKETVIKFVKKRLKNRRKAVVKKAQGFLKRHQV